MLWLWWCPLPFCLRLCSVSVRFCEGTEEQWRLRAYLPAHALTHLVYVNHTNATSLSHWEVARNGKVCQLWSFQLVCQWDYEGLQFFLLKRTTSYCPVLWREGLVTGYCTILWLHYCTFTCNKNSYFQLDTIPIGHWYFPGLALGLWTLM